MTVSIMTAKPSGSSVILTVAGASGVIFENDASQLVMPAETKLVCKEKMNTIHIKDGIRDRSRNIFSKFLRYPQTKLNKSATKRFLEKWDTVSCRCYVGYMKHT
jgi:hypothetical protein